MHGKPVAASARDCDAHRARGAGALVRALVLLGAVAAAPAHAASLAVDVEGLDQPYSAAVRSRLEIARYTKRDVSAAQVRRLFRRAEAQIRKALEPYGYYDASVDAKLDEVPGGFRATFRVAPGEPVLVDKLDLRVPDEARALRGVRRALRRFSPKPGERLDHAAYELGKANVQYALFADGYLDAEPAEHRVAVRRAQHRADITLAWDTGVRYRYGATTFDGSQLSDGFLDRYLPWQPGDYYDQDEVLQLQQRLADADYFSLIEVTPDVEHARDGVVPMTVTVARAKRTVYTGGVFVGTDSGPGVRGALDRRWVNRRGHKLKLEAEVSQRLNLFTALYRIPLPGRDERSWNYGAAFRDETTDTSESRTLRLTGNETRLWRGWTRTLGLQYLTGTFTVADEDGDTTLLYPEATLAMKSVDRIDFVRRGWSLGFALRGGYEGLASDTSFAQARADAKWIHSLGRRDRFIARGALGATWVDDFDRLPPELRFFAGGDRTIRGYGFETVGPRNAAGKVIGGKNLAVLSAEYEHWFVRDWGAAVFVDAGDAFTGTDFDARVGAGVGLRWRSPVGMVRVDVGVPVSDRYESGVQLHLVIGPDL